MTSKAMSEKLAAIGHAITPETVRKDWTKGAPRGTPEAYLRWRAKHVTHDGRSDPDAKALKAEKLQHEIDLLKERLIAEKRENEVKAGQLWRKDEVLAARKAGAARVRAVLDSHLRVDLPAKLAGNRRRAAALAVAVRVAVTISAATSGRNR